MISQRPKLQVIQLVRREIGGVFGQSGHFQARAKRPKVDINSLSVAALTIVDEYEFVCDTRKVRGQRDAHAGSKAHKINHKRH
jgi:hypothetical protein